MEDHDGGLGTRRYVVFLSCGSSIVNNVQKSFPEKEREHLSQYMITPYY